MGGERGGRVEPLEHDYDDWERRIDAMAVLLWGLKGTKKLFTVDEHRKAIESLPPRCRSVVVLRKLRGLSPREIAEQLGISEGTVHLHGAKGVRRCEEFLRQRGILGAGPS